MSLALRRPLRLLLVSTQLSIIYFSERLTMTYIQIAPFLLSGVPVARLRLSLESRRKGALSRKRPRGSQGRQFSVRRCLCCLCLEIPLRATSSVVSGIVLTQQQAPGNVRRFVLVCVHDAEPAFSFRKRGLALFSSGHLVSTSIVFFPLAF